MTDLEKIKKDLKNDDDFESKIYKKLEVRKNGIDYHLKLSDRISSDKEKEIKGVVIVNKYPVIKLIIKLEKNKSDHKIKNIKLNTIITKPEWKEIRTFNFEKNQFIREKLKEKKEKTKKWLYG